MQSFIYEQQPCRIIFGAGTIARLREELERLKVKRPLFICTPGRQHDAQATSSNLTGMTTAVYSGAVMHVPIETIARAIQAAEQHSADSIISFGGGSAIDTSKAVGLQIELPVLAVPTTYGGSEVTPFYGATENDIKKGHRDRKMLPKVVIYDPELTVSLPPSVSGPSGINAIAHCVEGLYGKNANPVMSLLAAEGIRVLARSLPTVVAEPANIEARSSALYGAWLAGMVLGSVGMAIHHSISHVLGGTFRLPHADVHTVVLPHAVQYNRDAAPQAMQVIAKALDATDAAQGILDLEVRIGAPTSLKQLGMPENELDRAARIVVEHAYHNPRPVEYEPVRRLLENAYRGELY